jgi:hypothetical protein
MNNEEMNVNTDETVQKENYVPGWKDARITVEMPLHMIVDFLNILNNRLCFLEDSIRLADNEGNTMSVTEFYAMQAQAQVQADNTSEGE